MTPCTRQIGTRTITGGGIIIVDGMNQIVVGRFNSAPLHQSTFVQYLPTRVDVLCTSTVQRRQV